MSKIDLFNEEPFYDCNTPPKIDGYTCKELSEDVYRYERIVTNTQEECKSCKHSPEFNNGVYTLKCGDCERYYGSKYHNGIYLLDEYEKKVLHDED